MPKTFLISPVRGFLPETWRPIVERLEAEGYTVHWPARDTVQTNPVLDICKQNRLAILGADVVHVIWDGKSEGGCLDLGMCLALGKRLIPILIPAPTEGKSIQNLIIAMAKDGWDA